MQDDTLGISVCGFRSQKMNTFINKQTNLMVLKFGRDKCKKCLLEKGIKTMTFVRIVKLMRGKMRLKMIIG